MTKHSKNNTASSIFSYAEYKKLDYGTKRQRLGHESMRRFDACALCLQRAREPVACQKGHLFCKECVYTDLVTQLGDIKRQKVRLEALEREAKEEKERAQEAARERVLLEFERGQLGLSSSASTATTSGAESKEARGTKRKFDFDSSTVDVLAREAEEAALREIEREQAESLKHKLPDFWLPSLTPTYTSSGPPTSLSHVKLQTTCRGGNPPHPLTRKNLIPVNFFMDVSSSVVPTRSLDSTPATDAGQEPKSKREDDSNPICPSCKKELSNNTLMNVFKPCGHVACKTCTDTLVKPAKQCIVCDVKLGDKDIIELTREGTGYAAGGLAETSKKGVAFQG
ncbi:Nitric oxide synthase-interacting protein [Grifola frondosa]|uniref:Nitric oxide synthase-interacting protein n=1 Tax=Grifola frondosa TaxID=5627 RepID=A0A1C7MJN8_GRIFR|nr:Nitric oxide synthase-interacting protein [Grifola frondosa]